MKSHDTFLPKGTKVQGGYEVGFRRLTDEEYLRDMAEWMPPMRENILHTHKDKEAEAEAGEGSSWKYTGTRSKYYHEFSCMVEECPATEARLCNRFARRDEECKCDVT